MVEERPAEAMADVSDEDLVARFLGGDREAFAQIYLRYYPRTYRLAFGMSASRETAEDLTQEVFARVASRLRQFQGTARFSTWFYRVAINVFLRFRERRGRAPHQISDPVEREVADRATPSVEDDILGEQVRREVHKALLSLPPVPRMIVILRDIEGLGYAEISERLGCSEGTVASRLSRARRMLGRKLEHLRGAI